MHVQVVHTLIENQKRTTKNKKPVPFRENKLTQLLMDVLSGDFLCTLILNASPSPVHNQVNMSAKTIAFGEGAQHSQCALTSPTSLTHTHLTHFTLIHQESKS